MLEEIIVELEADIEETESEIPIEVIAAWEDCY